MSFSGWESLRVNTARLRADFESLSQIGASEAGGVHRPALSSAHLAARRWFADRASTDGLEFWQDAAGNHSARLSCGLPHARTLLLGSHLDSVPNGGRYDGALGVLAALEVLRVTREAGLALPLHLEAIDFTDEEGTLVGLLGSAVVAGLLSPADLISPRGGRAALEDGLQRAGLEEERLLDARRDPASLAGYLELHIEQGPRLFNTSTKIGIVSAIVGICSYRVDFIGKADHAGTTPMLDRRDAGQGACAFTLAARQIVLEKFPDCVVNVGDVRYAPGAYNIVPERASLALELRAPDAGAFDRLEAALLERARFDAECFQLGIEASFLGRHQPTPMSQQVQAAFGAAADALGLPHVPLVSGAGHDAQCLAAVCPAGMVFIPSVNGASHSPREFSDWEDCVNGANVLLQTALRVAQTIQ